MEHMATVAEAPAMLSCRRLAHEYVDRRVESAAEPCLPGRPESHDSPPYREEGRGVMVHVQERHLTTCAGKGDICLLNSVQQPKSDLKGVHGA